MATFSSCFFSDKPKSYYLKVYSMRHSEIKWLLSIKTKCPYQKQQSSRFG